MSKLHYSVLLNEVVQNLDVKSDGTYVDLTLGMGGHAGEILKKLSSGLLIGFDKDRFAIEESRNYLAQINNNFQLVHTDFKNITEELSKMKITAVDGIIADLGISSPQVDNVARGFSYNKDSRLDMRMNQDQDLDAYYIVNTYSESALRSLLQNNAEVKLAHQVAKAIVKNRPITSTLELANIVRNSLPAKLVKLKNPCKAVFQAIRIEVNSELENLQSMLEQAVNLLKPQGKLAIITFHSLEDRIVKRFFGKLIKSTIPSKMPIKEDKNFSVKVINPSAAELDENKRSRSAKLRILTKLK